MITVTQASVRWRLRAAVRASGSESGRTILTEPLVPWPVRPLPEQTPAASRDVGTSALALPSLSCLKRTSRTQYIFIGIARHIKEMYSG